MSYQCQFKHFKLMLCKEDGRRFCTQHLAVFGYYPLCLSNISILNDVVEGCSGLIQYHKIPIVHPRLTVGGIPRISRVRMCSLGTFLSVFVIVPRLSAMGILPFVC